LSFRLRKYYGLGFLLTGLILLFFTNKGPIADFGNYYYGSKLFLEGKFSVEDYKSIHHFNEQIKTYGEKNYFENYTPVPPFSLLFYLPFALLSAAKAKLVFNLFSLVIFCISLQRLFNYKKISTPLAWLFALFVFYPLYSNLSQGQAYLLITALLSESYMAYRKKQNFLSIFLLSLTISLKIFTGFLLLYFILKKEYRYTVYTFLTVIFIGVLTHLCIGNSVMPYYVADILPRLAANEILEPYHYSSQSLHVLLMKLFSFDQIQNPVPLLNIPIAIPILESIFLALIISGFAGLEKKLSSFTLFSLVLFSILLVSRHSAGYSLLLIIPLCITLVTKDTINYKYLILASLVLAVNIPASFLATQIAPLQFLRFWLFLVVFFTWMISYSVTLNYRLALACFFLFSGISYISFSDSKHNYFSFQNTKGALYDFTVSGDDLILHSCYGDYDIQESYVFAGDLKEDKRLTLTGSDLFYNGKIICNSADHKLKPMLVNDTTVLFLSDLNQGVGFYKLRTILLPKE
jgi:hypothetical protein